MLRIIIQGEELFNEEDSSFSSVGDVVMDLEHSLLSLSKWESKYKKPFLSTPQKSTEEVVGYIKAMVITPEADLSQIHRCSPQTIDLIWEYIDSAQSATTFGSMPERKGPGETITSELIYYWMVAFNIPFEVEKWHLNRLFSLIRICNIKNTPPKKMSRSEIAMRNRELNAKRKAELGTTG